MLTIVLATFVGSAAAGACSGDDQTALADGDVVGEKANDCGHQAFSLIGGFDADKFNTCFTASAGISSTCSACYATSAQYSVKNCKVACISKWCKSGCLSCTEPAQEDLAVCTGFTPTAASPCDGELSEQATGACSGDDQTALADGNVVGEKANDCGHQAFSLVGGFDADKFNTCFTASAGISSTCSACYATSAQYSVKNCKVACISKWCKSGCLSCTEPAQDDLAVCTGFTGSAADPCDGELSEQGSCSGTDDFAATPTCYGANVLGQEDIVVQIKDYSAGAGHLTFTGTGQTPLSCESAFTKDASNNIDFDCDVSKWATVKGAQYCSDTDELKATFNPLGVPIPVSATFPKIACPSSLTV